MAFPKPGLVGIAAVLSMGAGDAAAVDVVSIPSLDGKLQLPGYWFKAAGTEARPAVVTLHGCGGLLSGKAEPGTSSFRAAEYFNVEKMHMLALDSFTPRGEKSICEIPEKQRRIQPEDRREDVFAAIQWLARQPGVDKNRIALVGYSNGGAAVLSVLDRTDSMVQAQPIQPRAAVAYYPGCERYASMWSYEISAPLLLMIGDRDDWTPVDYCVRLHNKVKRAQPGASFDLVVYPGSQHGFDGYSKKKALRTGLPTPSGTATVLGDPEAREDSHKRLFDFLSARMDWPLRLTHQERLKGHRFVLPTATGFAEAHDRAAVPLGAKGRAVYERYLGRDAPKAFAISEKGFWSISWGQLDAMHDALDKCQIGGVRCWLYAVDDRVVWSQDLAARIDAPKLQRKWP